MSTDEAIWNSLQATGAVAVIVGLIFAIAMDDELQKREGVTRFRWGYFFSISHMVGGIGCALVFVYFSTTRGVDQDFVLILAAYCILGAIASYFAMKRTRLGWIIATLMSLNIFIWVINAVYGSYKWKELSGATVPSSNVIDVVDLENFAHRALLVGSLFWIGLVFLYGAVIVWDWDFGDLSWDLKQYGGPYIQAALFPPIVIIAAYIAYACFVKESPSTRSETKKGQPN